MANLLDQFKEKVSGSAGRIVDFGPNMSSNGDFNYLTDFEVITSSWTHLLQTPRRSYIDDPEYGSDLRKFVFYPADTQTISSIKTEIKSRIAMYDNRASIANIEVSFLSNRKGFVVDIDVNYSGELGSFRLVVNEPF